MRPKHLWMVFLSLIAWFSLAAAPRPQGFNLVNILSPQPGDVIQGIVPITGNTVVDNLETYEVAFSFAGDGTQETWFTIQIGDQAVREGLLAEWDTNSLTDGTYSLRLIITRANGDPIIDIVDGLRLRNYSPIETNTPTPTPTGSRTPSPSTRTPTPLPPTPTPLPPNPIEIRPAQFKNALITGAVTAVLFLAGLNMYVNARKRAGR